MALLKKSPKSSDTDATHPDVHAAEQNARVAESHATKSREKADKSLEAARELSKALKKLTDDKDANPVSVRKARKRANEAHHFSNLRETRALRAEAHAKDVRAKADRIAERYS